MSNYVYGKRWIDLTVRSVLLTPFKITLDMTIIATAIPRITTQFNSINDVGWYGSAYLVSINLFQSEVSNLRLSSDVFTAHNDLPPTIFRQNLHVLQHQNQR